MTLTVESPPVPFPSSLVQTDGAGGCYQVHPDWLHALANSADAAIWSGDVAWLVEIADKLEAAGSELRRMASDHTPGGQ